ncbi:MAG: hypothetical protein OXU69_05165 [Gemmatimonadota bacterium]|nr:hypothetical protein [Gemmatimonadota bacterium]MDE2984078.1 hypothetical protein [Gemmatimonadota bacterium]
MTAPVDALATIADSAVRKCRRSGTQAARGNNLPGILHGLLGVLVFPAAAVGASSQEVTVLTEDLCASCSIEITADVVLGTDGESVIGLALDIERLPDGRFAMAFDDVMYEFTVFSPDGSEYRRVGRAGEGPGEYGHVWFIREHGDRLHVFDRRRRRMTVLDHDYEVVGTMPVECVRCDGRDMAILPDGSAAINFFEPQGGWERRDNANAWLVVHILGDDGRPRVSIPGVPAGSHGSLIRHLDIASDGSLAVAESMRYRIERRDPGTGELLETFVRDADWWPDENPVHAPRPDLPPVTAMNWMHVDEAGRLWLYIERPTADWRDHVENTGLPEHMGSWRYGRAATEWVVEVVDMEAGKVIVSQVVDVEPAPRAQFFAPGWLAVHDDEDIVPRYRMYRLRLTGLE